MPSPPPSFESVKELIEGGLCSPEDRKTLAERIILDLATESFPGHKLEASYDESSQHIEVCAIYLMVDDDEVADPLREISMTQASENRIEFVEVGEELLFPIHYRDPDREARQRSTHPTLTLPMAAGSVLSAQWHRALLERLCFESKVADR